MGLLLQGMRRATFAPIPVSVTDADDVSHLSSVKPVPLMGLPCRM